MDLRREPFRLFFPLGLLLGLAGVVPWSLFALGRLASYPATFHALTMTQGFLTASALGFLGTMLPRRTRSAPATALELGLAALGLVAAVVLLALGRLALAELAWGAVLLGLVRFVVSRLRATRAPLAPPPSFVLLPVGLALGAVGALLVALSAQTGAPAWALPLGRSLAGEGLLLGLVLALAPMLSPILAGANGPAALLRSAAQPRGRGLHLGAALLLATSFVLQLAWPGPALLLRGAVVLAELVLAGGLRLRTAVPGLHRRLYRLALLLTPTGPLAAGLLPGHRVALQHLGFVGGFSLMVFAVATHVSLHHTGHEERASTSPAPLWATGLLVLGAATLRAGADFLGPAYLGALGLASMLWLLGALAWGALVVPLLVAREAED